MCTVCELMEEGPGQGGGCTGAIGLDGPGWLLGGWLVDGWALQGEMYLGVDWWGEEGRGRVQYWFGSGGFDVCEGEWKGLGEFRVASCCELCNISTHVWELGGWMDGWIGWGWLFVLQVLCTLLRYWIELPWDRNHSVNKVVVGENGGGSAIILLGRLCCDHSCGEQFWAIWISV